MTDRPTPISGSPSLLQMAQVAHTPVEWLWPSRLAVGKLTVIAGRPGGGKSFLTCDMAARVSRGLAWPDGTPCPSGSVLLLAAEDDPADTIRPRLEAHGADLAAITVLEGVHQRDPIRGCFVTPFGLDNPTALETAIDETGEVALVVIDPIGSYLGRGIDAYRDNEVRAALTPLTQIAARRDVAVVLVAHTRKGSASHADDLVLGSRAFTGIARSVFHVLDDPEDESRRLFLPGKSNLCQRPEGLAFQIAGDPAKVCWSADRVQATADEILGASCPDGEGSARAEAVAWLRDFLSTGSKPAREVKAAAKVDGISSRTLDRAKPLAGVMASRHGFGKGAEWCWSLRHSAPDEPEERQTSDVAYNDWAGALCRPAAASSGPDQEHERSNEQSVSQEDGVQGSSASSDTRITPPGTPS